MDEQERLVEAAWDETAKTSFQVEIMVMAFDRDNLPLMSLIL